MSTMTKLNAGFATIGQGAGPMMVTERAGIFRKHGLDVQIRLMGGAVGVVRGLVEGEIQFGNLAAPALFEAVLAGRPEMVFLTGGINQQFLMARPGIQRREQLAGGTLGVVGDAGLNDVLVHFIMDRLADAGIHDIRTVPLPRGEKARLAALVESRCDALVITPPEALRAKKQGCSFVVDFAEYGLNYALGGLAARRDYIERNEQIIRRVVMAYVEGMHRYRTDRDFTVAVQQEYSGIDERAIAEETYDLTQPGMPPVPKPVPAAFDTALKIMTRTLPAAKHVDPARFIDDRFIRELEANGFVASLSAAAGEASGGAR